jgi:hypothetical protein
MVKSLILLVILNNFFVGETFGLLSRQTSWLHSCNFANCTGALEKCIQMNCYGEKQCTECVDNYDWKCFNCIDQIYDPLKQYFKNGDQIRSDFVCDNESELQKKACQMYCRGIFYSDDGYCQDSNYPEIPLCVCKKSNPK